MEESIIFYRKVSLVEQITDNWKFLFWFKHDAWKRQLIYTYFFVI